MGSHLVDLIEQAIEDCFQTGHGKAINTDDIEVVAEWVESEKEGCSVMCLSIIENGVVKFSYNDYGTELPNY